MPLKAGVLIKIIETSERSFGSVFVHCYKHDYRNNSYVHPLGVGNSIIIPPIYKAIPRGTLGMFIKSLPVSKGWHQGGDVDCLALFNDELLVVADCDIEII